MATHSSILAWRIPGMGEPGGLLSMGSHRVGHDWSDLAAAASIYKSITLQLEIFSCSVLQDNFRTWPLSIFTCLHWIIQLDAPPLHQCSYVIVSGYPNSKGEHTSWILLFLSLFPLWLLLFFFALFLREMLHKQWILRTGDWGMVKELLCFVELASPFGMSFVESDFGSCKWTSAL